MTFNSLRDFVLNSMLLAIIVQILFTDIHN